MEKNVQAKLRRTGPNSSRVSLAVSFADSNVRRGSAKINRQTGESRSRRRTHREEKKRNIPPLPTAWGWICPWRRSFRLVPVERSRACHGGIFVARSVRRMWNACREVAASCRVARSVHAMRGVASSRRRRSIARRSLCHVMVLVGPLGLFVHARDSRGSHEKGNKKDLVVLIGIL
ncbi:hypothetical protein K0M31_013711 [Melipona bicolor]|uniref:Uncharacterized protein n=1 Tax=Melipona bicolor TaxID=60889 RepID=A0AA40FHF3_9HYME|nr:hypothetical protein K0M31_013711 [Melipona bicolor]